MFYLRNVEREIRADKDVAVVENVRLKRELETLQNDLDRNRGSKYRTRRGGGGGGGGGRGDINMVVQYFGRSKE